MKKRFFVSLIAALFLITGVAFADYQEDSGVGVGNVTATTLGGGIDAGFGMLPGHSGFAGGIGVAGGINIGGAFGAINDGTVQLEAGAFSGGVAENEVERHSGYALDKSIGISSSSAAAASTQGNVAVSVDPMGHYIIDAGGLAAGGFFGVAGQATVDFSAVGASPLSGWESEGYSAGIAGQGSAGYVYGVVDAESLGDLAYDKPTVTYEGGEDGGPGYYWKYKNPNQHWREKEYQYFPNGHPEGQSEWNFLGEDRIVTTEHIVLMDSIANAASGASIDMEGHSFSESWRAMGDNDGQHTEMMGTFVYADTQINAIGYADNEANGRFIVWDTSNSGACVGGGYVVAGGAGAKTVQTSDYGVSKATAMGIYTGSAGLNTTFNGVAIGSTQTSVTTVEGMNGAFHGANAQMTVTSTIHND